MDTSIGPNKSFEKDRNKVLLGKSPMHAAPGNHKHLEGLTITGVTTAQQINSIIAALIELGAVDAR